MTVMTVAHKMAKPWVPEFLADVLLFSAEKGQTHEL
jgi:hypothetical protein